MQQLLMHRRSVRDGYRVELNYHKVHEHERRITVLVLPISQRESQLNTYFMRTQMDLVDPPWNDNGLK